MEDIFIYIHNTHTVIHFVIATSTASICDGDIQEWYHFMYIIHTYVWEDVNDITLSLHTWSERKWFLAVLPQDNHIAAPSWITHYSEGSTTIHGVAMRFCFGSFILIYILRGLPFDMSESMSSSVQLVVWVGGLPRNLGHNRYFY